MSLKVGVPAETYPEESRVALTPEVAGTLSRNGQRVLVQAGAGIRAGFRDAAYAERGVEIVPDRTGVFERSDVVLQVRTHGANPENEEDLALIRPGQILIGMSDSLDGCHMMKLPSTTRYLMY